MSNTSLFDIMGPIMVGPSSSHTAGALRLGRAARVICGTSVLRATFHLHGSFAKTYQGHGTDRALIAGIMGMETEDERIKDSILLAEERGLQVTFIETDMGDVHPNTVRIDLTGEDGREVTVTGSSVGGGKILITEIDGDNVSFDATYPVIVVKHHDRPGMVSKITAAIAVHGINIATLKVGRITRGDIATTVVETDSPVSEEAMGDIGEIEGVTAIKVVNI